MIHCRYRSIYVCHHFCNCFLVETKLFKVELKEDVINPSPAEPGYTLPLQTV